MDTIIYFVRHAHSEFDIHNEEKRELSDKGRKDTERVMTLLKDEDIEIVYSSSYVRAIQTVQGIADYVKTTVHTDQQLREGWLADADVVFDDPDEAVKYAFENPTFSYKGGESVSDLQKRGSAALEDILKQFEGKRIVLGTHGYIFTSILNYYDSSYNHDFLSKTTKPDIYKVTFQENLFKEIERLWSESFK
ncbi:2,3-bisphosphoglycerate-dependent phosphoglycerate mutase [Bacillus mesophilus]|uniref:Histidine phosphatase family protein n=1 Tax=Bacillus mesophilus TaxID=1808955 RepID=A0A6M0Q6I7_9BACI|nr:histidine phosphatase family protein [Bacillus mesophilus]MBM7660371.1 2,3-bisphosphoglycerate-dependent phosphoglycerate mutase [Bacillus mesophilus]NEY71080.1 histidine phosphatase family protein [Bacillus mesophilus]